MNSTIHKIRLVTTAGLLLNILLTAAKCIGGVIFFSQALIADGIHSLSDLVTDVAVLLGTKYWSSPPDTSHPYGYGRIETIISTGIGFILGMLAFELIFDAVGSWINHIYETPEIPAFFIAVFSVISKTLLYIWTKRTAATTCSSALNANAQHHKSDAISSIPAAIAIVVAHTFPELRFADQIGSLVVSGFILLSAWQIVKPAMYELSDGGNEEVRQIIVSAAEKYPQIRRIRTVRTRMIGSRTVGDMIIMLDPQTTVSECQEIINKLRGDVLENYPQITELAVYAEPYFEK